MNIRIRIPAGTLWLDVFNMFVWARENNIPMLYKYNYMEGSTSMIKTKHRLAHDDGYTVRDDPYFVIIVKEIDFAIVKLYSGW